MMKTTPGPTFEVIETELFLELPHAAASTPRQEPLAAATIAFPS
jgi:hypothetical protein